MENVSASSPSNPHFFQPLLPGFHSHLHIPTAFFSKHIVGTTNEGDAVVKLRSNASDITWEVKMDGRRLTQGWQKFATSHDLRVGDIVVFRHDGDLLFHVTCFGPSCCEIQYDDNDVIQISSDSDSDSEKNGNTADEGSSADHHSCFVVRVTASNLRKDTLFPPIAFSRSKGLMNRKCEIILLNEDGKPWTLILSHRRDGEGYIKSGWRSFCVANRLRANDFLTLKLVKTGTTPVLQLCSSSTTSQNRFLTLTLKPYNLKKCKLCLPRTFVKANGIEKAREITLVDRYGVKRTTSLKPDDKHGRRRLGKEWREFCDSNGVKMGDSFKLELIKEEVDTATHLLRASMITSMNKKQKLCHPHYLQSSGGGNLFPPSRNSSNLLITSRGSRFSVRAAKGTNTKSLTGVVFEPFEEIVRDSVWFHVEVEDLREKMWPELRNMTWFRNVEKMSSGLRKNVEEILWSGPREESLWSDLKQIMWSDRKS